MNIKDVQRLLNLLGQNVVEDGLDGPKTQAALASAIKALSGEEDDFWDGIVYFQRQEFRCPCGKWCDGFPVEPAPELVQLMEELRETFGRAIIIVPPDGHSGGSGVRCKEYNATFSNSATNSYHLLGKAADWSCPGKSAATIEAELERRKQTGQIRCWYRISAGNYHVDVN